MKPKLGEYIKIEVGKGNFFKGFVSDITPNNIFVILDKANARHSFSYFQVREIYTKDEFPELYL